MHCVGFGHHRQVGLPSTEALVAADYRHSLNLPEKTFVGAVSDVNMRPIELKRLTVPAKWDTRPSNATR